MASHEPPDPDDLEGAGDISEQLEDVQLDDAPRPAGPRDVEDEGDIGMSLDPAPVLTTHNEASGSSPSTAEEPAAVAERPHYSEVLTPPATEDRSVSPFEIPHPDSPRLGTPDPTRSLANSRPTSPRITAASSPRTLLSPRQFHSPPLSGFERSPPSLPSPTDRSLRSPPPDLTHAGTSPPLQGNGPSPGHEPPADSTRFESIPLRTTPPQTATFALPSSPHLDLIKDDNGKRRSWNGFSLAKHRESAAHGSSPALASPELETAGSGGRRSTSAGVPNGEAIPIPADREGEAGSSTPPRRHAPAAHPHPFPVPSSSSVPPPALGTAGAASGSAAASKAASRSKPSTGLSTFEKVVSHTRPSHLPPKPREEDDTHYHQWEEMMAQAREHEAAARKVREARRAEKESRLWVNTPRWEELLRDPQGVEKVKNDADLRKLWFEGSPSHLRGQVWARAIGNPLAMRKARRGGKGTDSARQDAYKSFMARAKKAVTENRFPPDVLQRINEELDETLPPLGLFQRDRPMREDLREFLLAWVVYRSDDGLGYAPYISTLGAMFLLVSPPATAFVSLCNLLARPTLRAFYTDTKDEIDAYYRVFENLEADAFPKIYANCKNLGLKVPEGWFRSVLTEQVPFEAVCRLWDQIVLEGDSYIFRSCLAIVNFLEPRLHFPDKEEILSVLEGRNRATLAITEREKERARLKGEAVQEDLDGKMSVFGLTEEALFDYLEADQWKESRFERLVLREMPD